MGRPELTSGNTNGNGLMPIATGVAPPHSLEAEQSVLGAVLLSDRALPGLIDEEGLRPEHFYRERHRLIFAAMCELFDDAERRDELAIDVLTVAEHLRSKGQLEDAGGKAAIDELTGGVPGLGGVRRYAQIVKTHWEKRRTLSATYEIQAGVLNHDEQLVEQGRRLLDELVIAAPGQTFHVERLDFAEHLDRFITAKRPPGFPLPWPTITRALQLVRGNGTVFSGWTSVGKSQAAFQTLAHVHRMTGARCVAFITEMTEEEHGCRQLSRDSGIPYETLMAGDIGSNQHIDHRRLLKALSEFPFSVLPVHGESVETICRLIRQVRPDVALLDHFHALPDVGRAEDATNAVSKLLAAAKKANCHLILVAQLNRARDDASKKPPPTLRDLKATAALEHLPSNIVFVHRDSVVVAGTEDDDVPKYEFGPRGYIQVAKQRGGRTVLAPVDFIAERHQFFELDPRFPALPAPKDDDEPF